MQIPRTCLLTLGNRMNFFPLTVPNPTDNLGQVKVSPETDAKSVIKSVMMMMMIIIIIILILIIFIDS